jgi:hypothetical protein
LERLRFLEENGDLYRAMRLSSAAT